MRKTCGEIRFEQANIKIERPIKFDEGLVRLSGKPAAPKIFCHVLGLYPATHPRKNGQSESDHDHSSDRYPKAILVFKKIYFIVHAENAGDHAQRSCDQS